MSTLPQFESFEDFMQAFVLPRFGGASPHDQIAGNGDSTKRDRVVARFRHGGTVWRVDGDTCFEPLLVAWDDLASAPGSEPFGFRDTGATWALALRPDLHAELTMARDRGAGHLFARTLKHAPIPALPGLPGLGGQPAPTSPAVGELGPVRFDPDARPTPVAESEGADPAKTAALLEKANQGHHQVLVRLFHYLTRAGWDEIGEFPTAIDLWARDPDGRRVIFEAKTISDTNSLSQCRGALAQLVEYRLELGEEGDGICLITDTPIPTRRASILQRLGVAVLAITPADDVVPGGELGAELAAALAPRPGATHRKNQPRARRLGP
jgi:hypothetical protein